MIRQTDTHIESVCVRDLSDTGMGRWGYWYYKTYRHRMTLTVDLSSTPDPRNTGNGVRVIHVNGQRDPDIDTDTQALKGRVEQL